MITMIDCYLQTWGKCLNLNYATQFMASIVKHAISFSRPLNGLIKIQAS